MTRRSDREMTGSTLWDLGPLELLLEKKLGTAAYPVRPVSRLFAASAEDGTLADRLLALPRAERLDLVERDAVFRHESLARYFALRAEGSLLQGGCDVESAELAVAVACAIDPTPGGTVERTAALSFWLLGKSCLLLLRRQDAENAFEMMNAFLPPTATEDQALSIAGMAQLRYDQGVWEDAAMLFGRAAIIFARLKAGEPDAACRAQQGLLFAEADDAQKARAALSRALEDLDRAAAPSLAVRLLLTLAACEAALGERLAARQALLEARQLYELPAAPHEETKRAWLEARVATAMGEGAAAERLLDPVRRQLLAHGSLKEAAAVTLDLMLLRLRAGRGGAAELGGAFAAAFAGDPAAEPFIQVLVEAAAMESLEPPAAGASAVPVGVRGADAGRPASLADATGAFRRQLHQAAIDPGVRPAWLASSRRLADRLLRRICEHEDPLGAANGL